MVFGVVMTGRLRNTTIASVTFVRALVFVVKSLELVNPLTFNSC